MKEQFGKIMAFGGALNQTLRGAAHSIFSLAGMSVEDVTTTLVAAFREHGSPPIKRSLHIFCGDQRRHVAAIAEAISVW